MIPFLTMNTNIPSIGGITQRLETRLTQKGQVTIPVMIRSHLGLKPKDMVRFELDGDVLRLKPAQSKLIEGYGAVVPRKTPEDWKNVREEVERTIAQDVKKEDH